jgi:acetyltransferase-like isoleucine patch superfamily enzyme
MQFQNLIFKILKILILRFSSGWNNLTVNLNNLFFKLSILPFDNISIEGQVKIIQKVKISGSGKVTIRKNCNFGYRDGGGYSSGLIEIQTRQVYAQIYIDENVATNNNLYIASAGSILIGKNTLIGRNVTIMDFEAHAISPNHRRDIGEIGEVKIGENCWLGNNCVILKNTTLGRNSIVAIGAVVRGVFPENVVIGGVPAKIIKHLD